MPGLIQAPANFNRRQAANLVSMDADALIDGYWQFDEQHVGVTNGPGTGKLGQLAQRSTHVIAGQFLIFQEFRTIDGEVWTRSNNNGTLGVWEAWSLQTPAPSADLSGIAWTSLTLQGTWSGTAKIRKSGALVELYMADCVTSAATTNILAYVPAGYGFLTAHYTASKPAPGGYFSGTSPQSMIGRAQVRASDAGSSPSAIMAMITGPDMGSGKYFNTHCFWWTS